MLKLHVNSMIFAFIVSLTSTNPSIIIRSANRCKSSQFTPGLIALMTVYSKKKFTKTNNIL